jgi:hypothetical protein
MVEPLRCCPLPVIGASIEGVGATSGICGHDAILAIDRHRAAFAERGFAGWHRIAYRFARIAGDAHTRPQIAVKRCRPIMAEGQLCRWQRRFCNRIGTIFNARRRRRIAIRSTRGAMAFLLDNPETIDAVVRIHIALIGRAIETVAIIAREIPDAATPLYRWRSWATRRLMTNRVAYLLVAIQQGESPMIALSTPTDEFLNVDLYFCAIDEPKSFDTRAWRIAAITGPQGVPTTAIPQEFDLDRNVGAIFGTWQSGGQTHGEGDWVG